MKWLIDWLKTLLTVPEAEEVATPRASADADFSLPDSQPEYMSRITYYNGQVLYVSREPISSSSPCFGCRYYDGRRYGGNRFVCAMHPYGPDDDRCPDYEGEPKPLFGSPQGDE